MDLIQRTLLSVNTGATRIIGQRNGRPVRSAIGKSPVAAGTVFFGRDGIAGDHQANRLIHGGANRAVCAYDAGHWPWWRAERDLVCTAGSFGENLTLIGANEDRVCIGDQFAWGDVILEVTRPRGPCANLDLHLGRAGVAQAIARSAHCGWYMRVLREGEAPTGNAMIHHDRAHGKPTVTEAFVARYLARSPLALRQRLREVSELSSKLGRTVARNLS